MMSRQSGLESRELKMYLTPLSSSKFKAENGLGVRAQWESVSWEVAIYAVKVDGNILALGSVILRLGGRPTEVRL